MTKMQISRSKLLEPLKVLNMSEKLNLTLLNTTHVLSLTESHTRVEKFVIGVENWPISFRTRKKKSSTSSLRLMLRKFGRIETKEGGMSSNNPIRQETSQSTNRRSFFKKFNDDDDDYEESAQPPGSSVKESIKTSLRKMSLSAKESVISSSTSIKSRLSQSAKGGMSQIKQLLHPHRKVEPEKDSDSPLKDDSPLTKRKRDSDSSGSDDSDSAYVRGRRESRRASFFEKPEEDILKGIVLSGNLLGVSSVVSEPTLVLTPKQQRLAQKYFTVVFAICGGLYMETALIVLLCISFEAVREFFFQYYLIKYIPLALYMIISFALSFFKKFRAYYPINYISLEIMAVFLALFAGMVSAQYELYAVLSGMLTATLLSFVLCVMAWFIPQAYTKKPLVLTTPLIGIIAVSTVTWFISYWYSISWGQMASSAVLIVAYSIYLVLVVRVIIKPSLEILESWDIIFGVLLTYASIVAILFHLLDFCGVCAKP